MARTYSMRGVLGAAERAVQLARAYLDARAPGSRVHDVQGDPRFQHRGVDLLWEAEGRVLGVEVKGDRQARRGTYFWEVISNLEKQTPGCFLYSEADALVYVFLGPNEVHHLPLAATRAWFLAQPSGSFPVKHTHTRIGQERYTTVGTVVPVERVLAEVEGAVRFRVDGDSVLPLPPGRLRRTA
ncbi:MAG TPA: hypothetical protein VK447_20580 [Myxococcaceae bacterium]|nr:hypothetical protein [Myxococcaceae bacterium]